MSKNYYEILGIPKNASQQDIKTAYRKLALLYHPDKNNGEHKDMFVDITTAYEILYDVEKRKQYDAETSETKVGIMEVVPHVFNFINVMAAHQAQIHNVMHSIHMNMMSHIHPPPQLNIHGTINISLQDKWMNTLNNITVTRRIYVDNNNVSTKSTNYNIPVYVNPCVLSGEGNIHVPSGKVGDVIISINVVMPNNYTVLNGELCELQPHTNDDFIIGVIPDGTEYKIQKIYNVIEQLDPNTKIFTKTKIPITQYTIPNKGFLRKDGVRSDYNIMLI